MKHTRLKTLRPKPWRSLTAEQQSGRIFYALIAMSALMFALFRLVGYDMPYDANPDYNAPLLAGTLISFMLLLAAAALAAMVWSAVRAWRMEGGASRIVNNIPARRISVCVAAGTAALMAATFALADTTPLRINGHAYADTFWLRTSGMFVATAALMIAAAVAAVAFGATRYIRKPKQGDTHKCS